MTTQADNGSGAQAITNLILGNTAKPYVPGSITSINPYTGPGADTMSSMSLFNSPSQPAQQSDPFADTMAMLSSLMGQSGLSGGGNGGYSGPNGSALYAQAQQLANQPLNLSAEDEQRIKDLGGAYDQQIQALQNAAVQAQQRNAQEKSDVGNIYNALTGEIGQRNTDLQNAYTQGIQGIGTRAQTAEQQAQNSIKDFLAQNQKYGTALGFDNSALNNKLQETVANAISNIAQGASNYQGLLGTRQQADNSLATSLQNAAGLAGRNAQANLVQLLDKFINANQGQQATIAGQKAQAQTNARNSMINALAQARQNQINALTKAADSQAAAARSAASRASSTKNDLFNQALALAKLQESHNNSGALQAYRNQLMANKTSGAMTPAQQIQAAINIGKASLPNAQGNTALSADQVNALRQMLGM